MQERPRPRRSVKLTTDEKKALRAKVKSFDTKYDAAIFFGLSRVALDRILSQGTAKESTAIIIREKLNAAA